MARMKRPIGDMVSGKIGNVVFVTIKDKSYVRSAPVRKKDNWSDQQKMYRQRLSRIARLWRSIQHEPMKQLWNQASDDINGYASFVKANMPALEIDGTLIDPRLLTVTEGKLVGLQFLNAQRDADLSDQIRVSWQNDKHLRNDRMDDALMAITFADDHFSAPIYTGLKRVDQSGTFTLPQAHSGTEGQVTLFLFVMSSDGQVSRSMGFGI